LYLITFPNFMFLPTSTFLSNRVSHHFLSLCLLASTFLSLPLCTYLIIFYLNVCLLLTDNFLYICHPVSYYTLCASPNFLFIYVLPSISDISYLFFSVSYTSITFIFYLSISIKIQLNFIFLFSLIYLYLHRFNF
jgi:hypothetical protein